MGTTKSRKSRRNNSRPTAFTFLSNIALGSENEKPPDESIRINSYLSTTDPDVLHYVEETTTPTTQVGGIHREREILFFLSWKVLNFFLL